MSSPPMVTVLMPVFNGERFLSEAVDSILNQTFADFEFIIIDDGSTDGTARILDSYTDRRIVRVCKPQNEGIVAALNHGLDMARGEFIARQDADDVSAQERLERQVARFRKSPELVVLGTAFRMVDRQGLERRVHVHPATDPAIRWQMLHRTGFCHPSVMMRADVLRRHGLRYDGGWLHAEDYEFWGRLLEHGRGANLDQVLVSYRLHGEQVSERNHEEQIRRSVAIAAGNIRRLGVSLPENVVAGLQRWFDAWPTRLRPEDLRTCKDLLRVLRRFGKQSVVPAQYFSGLRRANVERILNSLAGGVWRQTWVVGLMPRLLILEPTLVVNDLVRRLNWKLLRERSIACAL